MQELTFYLLSYIDLLVAEGKNQAKQIFLWKQMNLSMPYTMLRRNLYKSNSYILPPT